MRILVAEDDAVLADGVMTALRQAGYAVDWVTNGIDAVLHPVDGVARLAKRSHHPVGQDCVVFRDE